MSTTEKLPMPLQLAAGTAMVTAAFELMQLGLTLLWFFLHRGEVSITHWIAPSIFQDFVYPVLFMGFGLITVHAIYCRAEMIGIKFAVTFLAVLLGILVWSVGSVVASGLVAHFERLNVVGKIIFPVTRIGSALWLVLVARAVIILASTKKVEN
jgi:hypothetical protein